jgi:hypothetical protein
MDTILIGLIAALFFIYMYLYQRKYAEMYMSYSSDSASGEGFFSRTDSDSDIRANPICAYTNKEFEKLDRLYPNSNFNLNSFFNRSL